MSHLLVATSSLSLCSLCLTRGTLGSLLSNVFRPSKLRVTSTCCQVAVSSILLLGPVDSLDHAYLYSCNFQLEPSSFNGIPPKTFLFKSGRTGFFARFPNCFTFLQLWIRRLLTSGLACTAPEWSSRMSRNRLLPGLEAQRSEQWNINIKHEYKQKNWAKTLESRLIWCVVYCTYVSIHHVLSIWYHDIIWFPQIKYHVYMRYWFLISWHHQTLITSKGTLSGPSAARPEEHPSDF